MKQHLQELQDEKLKQQLTSERDQALFEQKIDFMKERMKEIQDEHAKEIEKYEKRIENEVHAEAEAQANKMEKELAKLAEKYEAKKKELKVVEKELSGLKS